MNMHLCKDCMEGMGVGYRYLPEIINQFQPRNPSLESMKYKLLNFFRVDSTIYEIEQRLTKLEKEIGAIKNTELHTIFDQKEQIVKMEKELNELKGKGGELR